MEVTAFAQQLPDELLRLGCRSLQSARVVPALGVDDARAAAAPRGVPSVGVAGTPIPLRRVRDATPVYGIDTSSIALGETRAGLLYALRGSIVWREGREYRFVRHGPFLFQITAANKAALYATLHHLYFDEADAPSPLLERTADRIRNVYERWLQRHVSHVTDDAILLWDGSLTVKSTAATVSACAELLRTARRRGHRVLALSKETSLAIDGTPLNDVLRDGQAPCLLPIHDADLARHAGLTFLGRVYAMKLVPSPFTFRLDVDRGIGTSCGVDAVQQLLGNDLIVDNYPETLRLAHIYARFSANEVLAMQRYVAERYGLRILRRPLVRQVLFGPYGGMAARVGG
jgi:hypothetical protein